MQRALEGPWTETQFAEYLTVEAGAETDEVCEERTTVIKTNTTSHDPRRKLVP
jgi:hypothetical protein